MNEQMIWKITGARLAVQLPLTRVMAPEVVSSAMSGSCWASDFPFLALAVFYMIVRSQAGPTDQS